MGIVDSTQIFAGFAEIPDNYLSSRSAALSGFIHINICPFHCRRCVVKTRRHAAPWLGLSRCLSRCLSR